MKTVLRTLALATLAACLLTGFALADTGPQPLLTVKLENAPAEPYCLDLLEEDRGRPYTEIGPEDQDPSVDPALTEALLAAVPEGWHACLLDHTTGAPISGDLLGEDSGGVRLHSFRYPNMPERYRIAVATEGGEVWISPVLERTVLQSSVRVDWADKAVAVPPVWLGYALQLLCTLAVTLVIEGALLVLLGFGRQKRNWLVFLLVNLVTQSALALYTANRFLHHGVSGWSMLSLIPAEIVITAVEILLYRRLLTGRTRGQAAVYGFVSNVGSAALGLFLVEPVWTLIGSIL